MKLFKEVFESLANHEIWRKCEKCNEVNDLIEEAKDIHYDLENDAEYMKGDRRGWKKNLKELKAEISKLGYNLDDYLIF